MGAGSGSSVPTLKIVQSSFLLLIHLTWWIAKIIYIIYYILYIILYIIYSFSVHILLYIIYIYI